MNRRHGSSLSPPQGVAKGMAELTRDIFSLAELQLQLFRRDGRDGLTRLLIPVALLLCAGIMAMATAPIVLILIAELLTQTAGLSRAAAFSIAALIGVIVAAALGLGAWSYFRGLESVFERSRQEWARNLTWIKQVLQQSEPSESDPPQEC